MLYHMDMHTHTHTYSAKPLPYWSHMGYRRIRSSLITCTAAMNPVQLANMKRDILHTKNSHLFSLTMPRTFMLLRISMINSESMVNINTEQLDFKGAVHSKCKSTTQGWELPIIYVKMIGSMLAKFLHMAVFGLDQEN